MENSAERECLELSHDGASVSVQTTLTFLLLAGALCTGLDFLVHKLPKERRLPISAVLFVSGAFVGTIVLDLIETETIPAIESHTSLGSKTILSGLRNAPFMDPHALFYILIPPLLFESSSTMSWHVLKKVLASSYLLAWPGVIVNTLTTGALVRWIVRLNGAAPSWEVSFLLAAVLSATDPVAVVATLRDIGAPAKLSTLIDGESLVNDGSGVVIMYLFQDMVMGSNAPEAAKNCPTTPLDMGCVIVYFIRIALGGTIIGIIGAYLLLLWIHISRSLHKSELETTLILVILYSTFFFAEGLGTSGVLATVTLGIFSAYFDLDRRLSREGRHSHHPILGQIAYICNLCTFFTSGLIAVRFMGQPHSCEHNFYSPQAWGEAAAMFAALHFSRALMVLIFSPVLRSLGYGLSVKEGLVLIFSGLRGAVALVMGMIIMSNEYIAAEIKQLLAFHISATVALTLLINGTLVGKLYSWLQVYPTSMYSGMYLKTFFQTLESDCRARGVYALSRHWFFQDVNFDTLMCCVPNFEYATFSAHFRSASPRGIHSVVDVMNSVSDFATANEWKSTLGVPSKQLWRSNFEGYWSQNHQACSTTFQDVLAGQPEILEQTDFMENVSCNQQLELVFEGGGGWYLSAQSMHHICKDKDVSFSMTCLYQANSNIILGLRADRQWPQTTLAVPGMLGQLTCDRSSVVIDCRAGTVYAEGQPRVNIGAAPEGAVLNVRLVTQEDSVTHVKFSWHTPDLQQNVNSDSIIAFGPHLLKHVFPVVQFVTTPPEEAEASEPQGGADATPTTARNRSKSVSGHMNQKALASVVPGFVPHLLADSERINGFFQRLFNILQAKYLHMFEKGLIGSQAYACLLEAVNNAMDSANHEINSMGVGRTATLQRSNSFACRCPPGTGAQDLELMDILEPLFIEFLYLEKELSKSSLLEKVAERFPVMKMFAYSRAMAKVEILWGFTEAHEDILQNQMFLVRFLPAVDCIQRLVETAKSDLSLLMGAMPHRVFMSKHGLALRILLYRRLQMLERAVASGKITSTEADGFANALQARVVRAGNFRPTRPWIPRWVPLFRRRALDSAEAWSAFKLPTN
eukprot:TRINITY_DN87528_c0_g1_i1.p1 TRINITY_DN87528_c0_g1~~TRINITY_DN87528_c0_g1_i1.p1  ORF type:complete len:1087 (-),score=169.99 TRINITY_DN87528_c0_g1_i1:119-3379(-)